MQPDTSKRYPAINAVLKRINWGDAIAVGIALLFLIATTIKVSLFNRLLIDPSVPVFFCWFHYGFFGKFILIFFLYILLLRWKRPFLFIIFYGLQILYMYTNLSYHYFFEGYLHVNQYFGLFSEAFELATHAAVPQNSFLWFILMDAPFFIGILVLYSKVSSLNRHYIRYKAFLALSAVLIFFIYKADFINGTAKSLATMDDRYSCDNEIVHKYGLLAYNIADILKYRDTRSRIKSLNYGREIAAGQADSTHPDFIIIQVESMDSYIISRKHKNSYVMPFLHSVSKKSVFYPYVLSYHKAGSTSDCEFSIINSVEPFDDYPAMKIRDYNYPNSMLKTLHAAGYDVAAFHGNRGSYFNRNIAFKKMGFLAFYDLSAMGLQEKGWGASDGDAFDFVAGKLNNEHRPLFYYIITMTSHEPFTLANLYYKTALFNDIGDATVRNYLISMSYVDGELKRFVGHVRENHANTYIFIYGDHTPPIIKNTYYKRAAFTHNGKLFEFVPLIIITPDGMAYRENKRIASFLDIAPTILPAAKISFKIKSNGMNLFSFPHDDDAVPFKGALYSRTDLFERIRKGNK